MDEEKKKDEKKAPPPPPPPPPHQNAGFRTYVAIGVVALAIVVFLAVAQKSGGGSNEASERSPKVLVVHIHDLRPTALDVAMRSNKAPNFAQLGVEGRVASCPYETRGASCATGADLVTTLTGTFPNVNASAASGPFSSDSYLKQARGRQMRPALIGTPTIFSSQNNDTIEGSPVCRRVGVVDQECFASACASMTPTCNAETKFLYSTQDEMMKATLSAIKQRRDIVYVQIETLASIADKSDTSVSYLSAIYKVDALVGQMVQQVVQRTAEAHESWLVVVNSNGDGQNNAVFAVAAYSNAQPYVLNPLGAAVSTGSTYATVAQWMGLEPTAGVNPAQGICSNGKTAPRSCLAASSASPSA